MTRSMLVVVASALVCISAFLSTALAETTATATTTATNYTVRFHDTATWPSVALACELVDNGKSIPLVCHSTSGKAAGVIVTRSKITVYDRTGKVVFGQKR